MDYVPLPRLRRTWKRKADFFRPFSGAAAAEAGENIAPLEDPSLHRSEPPAHNLEHLNAELAVLIEVFPDVEPDVFREMLSSMSAESRLEVVTEALLAKKSTLAKGRCRRADKDDGATAGGRLKKKVKISAKQTLRAEDCFRSEEYKGAVKQVFYQEFKSLSHSTIKAVMAEHNFSYTLARPVLQHLSAKSWRFAIPNFWSKRPQLSAASSHPFVSWLRTDATDGELLPVVQRTGSTQLDHELYELFVQPERQKLRRRLLDADHRYAVQINEEEALSAEALFDCECCYNSVPFERIATCDCNCHQLCFDCVRRSVNEALYGQGFARVADLRKSTMRCIAPVSDECDGAIPPGLVQRALAESEVHDETWTAFQSRLASESLSKSRARLQKCPFCSYAEVDERPKAKLRTFQNFSHYIASRTSPTLQVILLSMSAALLMLAIPLALVACMIWLLVIFLPPAAAVIENSLRRVYKRRRGLKFYCRNPACGSASCMRCTAAWRDPHTCFENEKTSLRTAIESSATAAIKRTCPKCLLSFVKSSGCNKLVCTCGYTMCYICRQEITSKEGYSHFCQHFRPSGGKCRECARCDLYGDEDEELAIRSAVEATEKAWRDREGGVRTEGDAVVTQAMVEAVVGRARETNRYEGWLDAIVDAAIM